MKLTSADRETLSAAAAELDGLALDIRMSCSIGCDGVRWDSPRDKDAHDRAKGLSAKLYLLVERSAT